MGAHTFFDTITTTASAQDAYRELVEDALHEYGHDGYNGTISTTRGCVPGRQTPMTVREAQEHSESRVDLLQKWGPAEYVPLLDETPATYEALAPVTVTFDVPAEVYNTNTGGDFHAALLKAAGLKPASHRIQDGGYRLNLSNVDVKRSLKTAATKGATETRYFVLINGTADLRWDLGHASQADARAAITALDENRRVPSPGWSESLTRTYEVVSMTRRASGEPLVTAESTARRVTGTATFTPERQVTPAKRGTEQIGWAFYGWAAS